MRMFCKVALTLGIAALLAAPALAQGQGKGKGQGQPQGVGKENADKSGEKPQEEKEDQAAGQLAEQEEKLSKEAAALLKRSAPGAC